MKLPIAGLAFLALLLSPGCKRDAGNADASPAADLPPRLVDDELGVELALPAGWMTLMGDDAGLPTGWLLDARLRSDRLGATRVLPRLVVSTSPLEHWLELDTLLDRSLTELKQIEAGGAAKIDRTVKGRRIIDGTEVGELRVDYRVFAEKSEQGVVQHSFLTHRFPRDGRTVVLSLDVTYLAADEERFQAELDAVTKSLRLQPSNKVRE